MAYEPELEKLQRRYEDDPARNFAQLAERYRKDGRLEDALNLLRMHLDERPNYVSGLVVLGRCLLDQQNDGEARTTFERVLTVDAEHIIALRALGEIAERTGDLGGARAWFSRLLEIDPMNEEAEVAVQRLATAAAAPPPEAAPEPESLGAALGLEAEAAEAVAGPPVVEQWAPREQVAEAPAAGFIGELPDTGLELPASEVPSPPPEYEVEEPMPAFMPRASHVVPFDVEQIGHIEIESQLPEEESLIGEPAAAEEDSPFALPTGLRDLDFGHTEPTAEPAAEAEAPAPPEAQFKVDAFDESLGWGAGERVSRQISSEDVAAAEQQHARDLRAPYAELPGLEGTELPPPAEVAAQTPAVEGLQMIQAPADVVPVEGLEPAAEPVAPPSAEELAAAEPLEVVREEIIPVVPEATPQAEAAEREISAPAKGMDRVTAERRASLFGLPVITIDEPPVQPLVLEAQPEPVVTETMGELYASQGLLGEAREVYAQLLARNPDDQRLQAKLAQLDARAMPTPREPAIPFAAAASGGVSARAFLADLLAARPRVAEHVVSVTDLAPVESAAPAAPDVPDVPDVPVAPPASLVPASSLEPMEEAYGTVQPEEPVESAGAPTQPASDEVSLADIFGEAAAPSAPAAPAPAAEPATAAPRAPGGFSFDEFFGKPTARTGGPERKPRDTLADDEGDEAFRDWLKSLKS
jgi:tetratricopeptide (TPR) repeat protein